MIISGVTLSAAVEHDLYSSPSYTRKWTATEINVVASNSTRDLRWLPTACFPKVTARMMQTEDPISQLELFWFRLSSIIDSRIAMMAANLTYCRQFVGDSRLFK